jgi:hypothetical protein
MLVIREDSEDNQQNWEKVSEESFPGSGMFYKHARKLSPFVLNFCCSALCVTCLLKGSGSSIGFLVFWWSYLVG